MSRELMQNFLENDEANLSSTTKKFLVNSKEIAFDEIEKNEFIKNIRKEYDGIYNQILNLLPDNQKELLFSLHEVHEAMIFMSVYIAYSYGWRDSSFLNAVLRSKEEI